MLSYVKDFFTKKKDNTQNISFQIAETKGGNNLEEIVKKMKYKNEPIKSFNDYCKIINTLISSKKNINELNYRYENQIPKEKQISKATNIEKMKAIGKIGLNPTEINSIFSRGILSFNKNKYEETKSFASIYTNNAVVKGKWCYEVQLITNGLFQLGWCQLTTYFDKERGVGDDKTSYSYDGWRMIKLAEDCKKYGELWEVGDYIGCGIDLENKKVEFFLNGKSLGVAFENVQIGKNIAYFPGMSIRKSEKCRFNFGATPFHFSYPGYQPLDIPLSEINETFNITKTLIDILDPCIFESLDIEKENFYDILQITNDAFNFITNVACLDSYCLRQLIFPYLHRLSIRNEKMFKYFINFFISRGSKGANKNKLFALFFDELTNLIEETSLIGENGIETWVKMIQLFHSLLKINRVIDIWLDTNPTEHMKNIFNSNTLRYPEFYDEIKTKQQSNSITSKMSITKMLREMMDGYHHKNGEKIKTLNHLYSKELSKMIYTFLSNTARFGTKKTMKDCFNILINTSHNLSSFDLLNLLIYEEKKKELIFLKNIYYNMLYLINEKYISLPFEQFSTYPFFHRDKQEDIYFNDVGIGGTINNTNELYIEKINSKFIIKNDEFFCDFFHKVIRLSNTFPIKELISYFSDLSNSWKSTSVFSLMSIENGTNKFQAVFRDFFYLFSFHSEEIFYKFSYFLISYLTWLKDNNKEIVYFIPFKIVELTFSFFTMLVGLKSKIFSNKKIREELNKSSPHFTKDDYIEKIVKFYLFLFSDESITNPEIRESLFKNIYFLLEKIGKIKEFFDKDQKLIDYLMKGILVNMQNDSFSSFSCKILLKLIEPSCLSYTLLKNNNNTQKEFNVLVNYPQQYLSNNIEILNSFLKSYSLLSNEIMTSFAINLSSFIDKLNNPYQPLNDDMKYKLYLNLSSSLYSMCNMLKLTEFFLSINAEIFFDLKSLNFTNFINLVKNLSLRIIAKPYITNLFNIIKEFEDKSELIPEKKRIKFKELGYIIVGIFLKIESMKNSPKYENFLKKIAGLTEINYTAFLELTIELKKNEKNAKILNYLSDYEKYINSIIQLKDKTILSQEELDKLASEDKLCILCYENPSNRKFVPCHHTACEECVNQYMAEKDICFICHEKIETVEENPI